MMNNSLYTPWRRSNSPKGFTLIELLLVLAIFGIVLAVVLPRAHRATNDAKFSMARQHASEIASQIVQWGQAKVAVQYETGNFSLINVLSEEISGDLAARAGFSSKPLVNRYTGDENFQQVSEMISGDFNLTNPFNNRSYFHQTNDDRTIAGAVVAPSIKPGLLYLASGSDEIDDGRHLRNFYLVITGQPDGNQARWFGSMGLEGEGLRHGIFVVRVPETGINPRMLFGQ